MTGRFRALKVVKREDFELERTFEREFEGIKHYEKVTQDHPGLVDVLHVGRDEGADFYYYVMELADDQGGQDLDNIDPSTYQARTLASDLRKNRVRDIAECILVGRTVAEALDHLHKSGLTHRDVKPSNIIFVKGAPRLADIGLVARSGQRTFVGTEGYVPPEGPGTSAADLYSLGMVLYEMHTGKDRLDFPELPSNHQLSPTVNRDEWRALNKVICQAGSPDPRKRFVSGQAFSHALRKIRPGEMDPLLKEQHPQQKPVYSHWILGISMVGLLLLLGVITLFWKDLFNPPPLTNVPPLKKEKIEVIAPAPPAEPIPEKPMPSPLPVTVPQPVVIEPEPTPILAKAVSRSIKLDSSPPGATVWFNGEEIGRTPTAYRDFEVGQLEFVFKKEAYLDKTETRAFDAGDPVSIKAELLPDGRPKLGNKTWTNVSALTFFLQTDGTFVAPVTSYAYESFLTSTGRPFAISAQDGLIKISDPKLRWAFCDWMTQIDRRVGNLDESQYHAPVPSSDGIFYCGIAKAFGTLILKSNPPGADIYQENQLLGTTPSKLNFRHGNFELSLALGGYAMETVAGRLTDEALSYEAYLIKDGSVAFGTNWTNSHNMPLIPVGKMMVAAYETRSRDFQLYLSETEVNPGVFPPSFPQSSDHPIVMVNREDAIAFCRWLTAKEQKQKIIRPWHAYRLPTDLEWSELAGTPPETGDTPKEREHSFRAKFPWGSQWPPTPGTGNFADETGSAIFGKYKISGFRDGFVYTAPVGSFQPSDNKLFDVSGNIWEWVSDTYSDETETLGVVRGGAWDSYEQGVLLGSYRNAVNPSDRSEQYGFRYILTDTRE